MMERSSWRESVKSGEDEKMRVRAKEENDKKKKGEENDLWLGRWNRISQISSDGALDWILSLSEAADKWMLNLNILLISKHNNGRTRQVQKLHYGRQAITCI